MSTMKTRSFLNPSNRCCSVPQCKVWRGVSLHHFPVNMKMRKKWINVLKIGKPITSHMFVCASHFVKEDFIPNFKPIRKRLKKNAVPSLHLPRRPLDKILTPVQINSRKQRAKRVEKRQILRNSISRCAAKDKEQSVRDIEMENKNMQDLKIKSVEDANVIISSESGQVDHKTCERKLTEEDDLGYAMTTFICSECNQQFINMRLFDVHISGFHSNNVESMFFPNHDDYIMWKHHMEEQTKIKYAILNKYTIKKIYHCTFLPSVDDTKEDTTISYLCPSSIIVQEFCKGIQVHYYKQHSGHPHVKYVLDEEYQKYTFTTLMKPDYEDSTNVGSDKTDLYLQFKTLMECIVLDAAEINVDILRGLIEKALDMTSVFNKYIEGFDTNGKGRELAAIPVKRENSIADGNISIIMEGLSSEMVTKKKPVQEVLPKKRTRKRSLSVQNERDLKSQIENQSPKIINTFSLAENPDLNKMFNEQKSKGVEGIKNSIGDVKAKKYVPFNKPQSFNDTYKNFVNKNFKAQLKVKTSGSNDRSSTENNEESVKKQAVVKTNVQQNKPSVYHDNTPKVDSNTKVVSFKTVDTNVRTVGKERKAVKTKIRHLKSSMSPKADSTSKVVSPKIEDTNAKTVDKEARINFSNVKVLEYEVKEQENDCNILILKI